MIWLAVAGAVLALGGGIWVGLGSPGIKGREDRVHPPGTRVKRLERKRLDWLRPPEV